LTDFLEVDEPLGASTLGSQGAFLDQRRTSDGTGGKRSEFFRFAKILSFFPSEGRVKHATIRVFPPSDYSSRLGA